MSRGALVLETATVRRQCVFIEAFKKLLDQFIRIISEDFNYANRVSIKQAFLRI